MVAFSLFFKLLSFVLLSPFFVVTFTMHLSILLIELFPILIGKIFNTEFITKYTYRQVIASDQSINALMAGCEDETISSRVGRVFPNSAISNFIDAIMFWQTDHCHKAIEKGEGVNDLLFPSSKYPGPLS